MNHKATRRTFIVVSMLTSLLLAGCESPPKAFTGYKGQNKIHLKVAANVPAEVVAAKDPESNIAIGAYIATNTPVLARQLFDEVIETGNEPLHANASVGAILTPKVAFVAQARGAGSGNQAFVDIKVEWTLTDAKGNVIWVDTVDGRSSPSIPDGALSRAKALNAAMEDLLLNSEKAISSAPAITQFAQKTSP